jgi:hypothetical protein
MYLPFSDPRVPGGQHHTLLPDVRGSRASPDGTSLIIPRLGAYLASVRQHSQLSLYVHIPFDDHHHR